LVWPGARDVDGCTRTACATSATTTLVCRLRDIEKHAGPVAWILVLASERITVSLARSVREALSDNPVLLAVIDPVLAAGTALRDQLVALD